MIRGKRGETSANNSISKSQTQDVEPNGETVAAFFVGVSMGLVSWIRGVFHRMIGQESISELFGIDAERSSDMETALSLYDDMRSGRPHWCHDDIRTIRFSNMVCREIANLVTLNISVKVTGNDDLQKMVDGMMNGLKAKQEECAATCGMMVKSDGCGVEFLRPENFIITEHDVSGNAKAAVFFAWLQKNGVYFVKAEYHRFEGNGDNREYKISTKVYQTKDLDAMGNEVPLSRVPEWENIEAEVTIKDLEYPLFVYWRTPYANTVDPESPLCVPIFSEAIEELKDLDIAYSRNATEIENSRRIVLTDDRLLTQAGTSIRRGNKIELPEYVKNVFGSGAAEYYQEINPNLNTAVRLQGIDALISQIGYKCGFSNGYFVFDQKTGMVTATQVESDDRRTLGTVRAFRDVLDGKNHDGVLHRMVYILYVTALGNGDLKASKYEVECAFKDLTDNPDEDRARAYQYVIQGILPKWYYLSEYEGMSEEEAKALVEEAEQAGQQEALFGGI